MGTNWAKEVFERAKERHKPVKRENHTFRLDEDLLKRFRKKCEEDRVTMTNVLEDFMRELLDKNS